MQEIPSAYSLLTKNLRNIAHASPDPGQNAPVIPVIGVCKLNVATVVEIILE